MLMIYENSGYLPVYEVPSERAQYLLLIPIIKMSENTSAQDSKIYPNLKVYTGMFLINKKNILTFMRHLQIYQLARQK